MEWGENADKYRVDKWRNYLISFKVPIEKIDIEGFDANIGKEIKSRLLIKYCINALAFSAVGKSAAVDIYNPIIFLKRDYDVLAEDILKIYFLEHHKGVLIPNELLYLKKYEYHLIIAKEEK